MKKYEECLRARLENAGVVFENDTYFENVASVKPVITEVPTIEIVDDGNRVAKKD